MEDNEELGAYLDYEVARAVRYGVDLSMALFLDVGADGSSKAKPLQLAIRESSRLADWVRIIARDKVIVILPHTPPRGGEQYVRRIQSRLDQAGMPVRSGVASVGPGVQSGRELLEASIHGLTSETP